MVISMENITVNKEFHELHFDSIQALRGLAALFVVFQHVRFLNFGAFGVDIFFCISGFMIMFTTEKSTKYFFRKRLVRILPLYYLMTLGTYLSLLLFPSMFQQTRHDFSYLVKSLLFIPFDIGSGAIQPLVRIGWTINCEMLFYLLFFIAFHISMKYRGLICSAFLAILVGMVQIFAPAISSWQSPIGNVLSPFLIFYGDPGISLRNSGLLSAAVFVSQAYPSSGFADSKPRIRGMYPGNLLSACLLYAPDQCDWVPQASPVGAPGSAIVNPCFSRRPAAFHAPLFCAVGKYQLFPVSGTLLSGYVSGPCGI